MNRRIIVVGAGIAGLAAAHRLIELNDEKSPDFEVMLLEASPRLGGAIATERVNDFVIEAGPDSFITEKPAALRLCERIGLAPRLLSTQAPYQKIYVVHRGKLEILPEGFFLLAPTQFWPFVRTPLFSWPGKLRMACDMFLPRGGIDEDESLASFIRRRFGKEALQRVAQPLIAGIYAADPDTLSLAATMPRIKEMEREQRSVIRAMRFEQRRRARKREAGSGARWSLFVSLADGMQELVERLARRLPANCTRLNSAATHLSHDENTRSWRVTIGNNEVIDATAVILATPAYGTAAMMESVAPAAADELKNIAYASTATVSLAYRIDDFPRPLDAFGFVVPAVENRKIMACTFSSLKYPRRAPAGYALIRAFVGGSLQPELFDDDDATMERNVREELAALIGVTAAPLFTRIHRYSRSMPQYHVGHQARIKRIESVIAGIPSLALAGSAYRGVGISDCVRSGEEAADKIARVIHGRGKKSSGNV